MINILVVDDEPLIHISIEKLIKTCSDKECVCHAYNGREMLDRLGEQDFALAYVDIKMPGISGLEAIKRGREISPFTRFYIMTGFNEFEYAKQAVKLKVEDYLMKPLDLQTIRETLTAAILQVQLNTEHRKDIFRNWLESTLNRRDSSFMEYTGYYCGLLLINFDLPGISGNVLPGLLEQYGDHLVSIFTENGLLLLFFDKKLETIHNVLRDLSDLAFPKGVTCLSSSISRSPGELKDYVPLLIQYSRLRVLYGVGHFYYLTPLLKTGAPYLEFCHACVLWRDAYRARDYTAFSNQSELICGQLKVQQDLSKYKENFLAYVALVLNDPEPIPSDPDSLRELFRNTARKLLPVSSSDLRIQPIIQFIQEHYRENISAANLSDRFNLSATHISNLLKNELGLRYNDYVTQLRLNHAKELLISTQMPVKEITSDCGYFSQSHFTKLFMEHEGCTPNEYRKKSRT